MLRQYIKCGTRTDRMWDKNRHDMLMYSWPNFSDGFYTMHIILVCLPPLYVMWVEITLPWYRNVSSFQSQVDILLSGSMRITVVMMVFSFFSDWWHPRPDSDHRTQCHLQLQCRWITCHLIPMEQDWTWINGRERLRGCWPCVRGDYINLDNPQCGCAGWGGVYLLCQC